MPLSGSGAAWGIFGGSFDPIHYAHLAAAEQARETLGLESVLFVPAGTPPHKLEQRLSAAQDRLAMIDLAIEGNPAFRSSSVELDRPGPSYTVDTLEQLAGEARGRGSETPFRMVFIMSVEALLGFPDWHEPQRLLECAEVAVARRRGIRRPSATWLRQHFPGLEHRFRFLDGPELGHSSTDIRRRVSDGRSIRYLVPPSVEAYIHCHQLYRETLEESDPSASDAHDEFAHGTGGELD